jgi:Ca2+-binding EF-hand superfamily protein
MFDWNNDGKVDIRDLVKVARRYKMTPGLFNYDNDADVNMNGQVDMADLTTVAANIGS